MRGRIFNIAQPIANPETGKTLLTEETITKAIEGHKSIKRWAYILHDKDVYTQADYDAYAKRTGEEPKWKVGDPKPSHWHVVLDVPGKTDTSAVGKWFGIPENQVEVPKGNKDINDRFLDCVRYLTHESEKEQAKGKYLYPNEAVRSNFDWRGEIDAWVISKTKYGKNLNERDQMITDVLKLGMTLHEAYEKYPAEVYGKNVALLQKCRGEYLKHVPMPAERHNFYVDGAGGIGKSLCSRALARNLCPGLADEDCFFIVGARGSAFDGYDGQPVIIWDDRRAYNMIDEFGRENVFNIFDTHPTNQNQNVKYSSTRLVNAYNIVNGIEPFNDFLKGLAGTYTDRNGNMHKAEDENQSYRRFPFIIEVRQEYLEFLVNNGFYNDNNQYREYLAYERVRGNFKRLRELAGNQTIVIDATESKLVKGMVEISNELMEKHTKEIAMPEDAAKELESFGESIPIKSDLPSAKPKKQQVNLDPHKDTIFCQRPDSIAIDNADLPF